MTHQPTQIRTELRSRIWKQPEPQSQHYTIGIRKTKFAKLEKVIRQTIPNSYTEQSPEKNYWALKSGGIRIHVQTRRGGRSRRFRDLDQDINKRYYFKV
jgi:hypothetical protein